MPHTTATMSPTRSPAFLMSNGSFAGAPGSGCVRSRSSFWRSALDFFFFFLDSGAEESVTGSV